jgi:hypothetical protein
MALQAPSRRPMHRIIGPSRAISVWIDAVIRVYDAVGNVIQTHEHTDDFKEP